MDEERLILRQAAPTDIEPLLDLLDRLNANGTGADPRYRTRPEARPRLRAGLRDEWFDARNPFPACWVACDGAQLAAMISGEPKTPHPILDEPPTARIHNLWVDPPYRRRGLARQLVATFREAAARAGFARVEVSTLARDATAVAFWRAVGMQDLRVVLSDP